MWPYAPSTWNGEFVKSVSFIRKPFPRNFVFKRVARITVVCFQICLFSTQRVSSISVLLRWHSALRFNFCKSYRVLFFWLWLLTEIEDWDYSNDNSFIVLKFYGICVILAVSKHAWQITLWKLILMPMFFPRLFVNLTLPKNLKRSVLIFEGFYLLNC